MLGHVRQQFRDGEVDRRLHRAFRPGRHPGEHVHDDGGVQRERLDGVHQTAFGEHRRVDPADQGAQFGQGGGGGGPGLGQHRLGGVRVGVHQLLGGTHRHAHRDHPGLRPVVQTALDPLQLCGLCLRQVGPDGLQFLHPPAQPGAGDRPQQPGRHRPQDPPGEGGDDQARHDQGDAVDEEGRGHRQVDAEAEGEQRQGGDRQHGHRGDHRPQPVPVQLRVVEAGVHRGPPTGLPFRLVVLLAVPPGPGGHTGHRRHRAVAHLVAYLQPVRGAPAGGPGQATAGQRVDDEQGRGDPEGHRQPLPEGGQHPYGERRVQTGGPGAGQPGTADPDGHRDERHHAGEPDQHHGPVQPEADLGTPAQRAASRRYPHRLVPFTTAIIISAGSGPLTDTADGTQSAPEPESRYAPPPVGLAPPHPAAAPRAPRHRLRPSRPGTPYGWAPPDGGAGPTHPYAQAHTASSGNSLAWGTP